jgi:hypothetical protein
LLERQLAELIERKAPRLLTRAEHDLIEGRLAHEPGLCGGLAGEHRSSLTSNVDPNTRPSQLFLSLRRAPE